MTEDTTETTRRNVFRALAAAAGLGALPATATAQQETPTVPGSSSPTPEEERAVVQIDQTTTLTDWEFVDGTFALTFECEVPDSIKVTDSGAVMEMWSGGGDGGGAGSIPTEGFNLSSGETTVEFAATLFDGAAAATVATADGTAFVFNKGIQEAYPNVEFGTAAAAVAIGAAGGGGYVYQKGKDVDEEDEQEVERIA